MSEASKIWNCGFYLQKSKNENGLIFCFRFVFFLFFQYFSFSVLLFLYFGFIYAQLNLNSPFTHFVRETRIEVVVSLFIFFISFFIFLEPNRIVIISVFKHMFEFKFRFIYFLVFLYSFFLWNLLSFSRVCIQSWF